MHQPLDDTDLSQYVLLASRETLPIEITGRPSRAASGGYTIVVAVDGHSVLEMDVSATAWKRISQDPALKGRQTVAFVVQQYPVGSAFGELGVLAADDVVDPWEAASCEYEASAGEEALQLVVLTDTRRRCAQRRYPTDLAREAFSMLAELCLSGARTPDAAAVDSFLASLGGVQ